MWYENEVFIATVAMTIIACWAMTILKVDAKDIVVPIVTGISGFVAGRVTQKGEKS